MGTAERSLHLQRGENELIHVLAGHNDGGTFLPSLQTLYWVPADDGDDETFLSTLSCSRTLVRLHLQQPDSSRGTPAVLKPDVHLKGAPLLRVLVIKWNAQHVNVPITNIVLNFNELRRVQLECEQLGPSDLEPLGRSQSLEYIHCEKVTEFEDFRRKIRLPGTRTLKVVGQIENVSSFVSCVEAPLLREFLVDIGIPRSPQLMLQCVKCIRSSSFSANLHTLHLEIYPLFTEDRLADVTIILYPVWLSSLLEPCYTLKTLQNLAIKATRSTVIIMTDDDLNTVARGSQRLRSLSISYVTFLCEPLPPEDQANPHAINMSGIRSRASGAPITVLRHFALHCPHLVTLSLDCVRISTEGKNLRDLSASWRESLGAARGHPLRNLSLKARRHYVRDVSFDPLEVEEYLDTLFPELDTARLREQVPGPYISDDWEGVVDGIAVRQRGRRMSWDKTLAV